MASLAFQLPFFLLLVLVLCPQIQAREGKVFSLFTHFRTIYNVKDHQGLPEKPKAKSPAPEPTPAPTLEPITAPTPTPTPITAPTPAPTTGSTIESGPAPEPDFVDMGNGYGLYGTESSSRYTPTKETPTTTTFQNELLDEDFTGESYKTSYPKTNSYNNNFNYNPSSYNHEGYRSSYNNGYNKNHEDSYSNNNYNERYTNNYSGNEYNNYYYKGNGYEVKKEGMSDTRFMENGKYYYPVTTNNENYNLNRYESVRGNIENQGYYEKTQYPNEFDTMEEYEKQQASQGYTP